MYSEGGGLGSGLRGRRAHRVPDAARDDFAAAESVEVAGQASRREGSALGNVLRAAESEGGRLLSDEGEHGRRVGLAGCEDDSEVFGN